MKKILSAIASTALMAGSVFATDAEYTWREGVRSTVVSNILGVSVTAAGDFAIKSNLTVTGSAAAASVASTAGITAGDDVTLTATALSAQISAIGSETNDAVLILAADQGDDAADTWTIESESADNDLSFVNGTTEAFKITSAGAAIATDDVTCDKIIFTDAAVAAPTNTASQGFTITVNGTNYVIALSPN